MPVLPKFCRLRRPCHEGEADRRDVLREQGEDALRNVFDNAPRSIPTHIGRAIASAAGTHALQLTGTEPEPICFPT